MDTTRFNILFGRYLDKSFTSAEKQELAEWILSGRHAESINGLLKETWEATTGDADMPEDKAELIFQSILTSEPKPHKKTSLVRFLRRSRWAAAAVLLIVAAGAYWIFFNSQGKQDTVAKEEQPASDVQAPVTNRAMVTLADGSTVYLDSAANGELALQGNIKLVKLSNGQISYVTSPSGAGAVGANTLSNPRGSKVIDMTLSDGSRVWLNAGSSITYPVAFTGNERKVSITGEAYFEITHNPSMPFKVELPSLQGGAGGGRGGTVQVLGTKFNVNAYDDELDIKVTLLEGSVNVTSLSKGEGPGVRLIPGQQAVLSSPLGAGASPLTIDHSPDLEEVMAWRNGKFQFAGSSIEEVMRQISRWYDVEVVYEVKPSDVHFRGGISRDAQASKVLKMLETTEAVHFRIEGKKVYVVR